MMPSGLAVRAPVQSSTTALSSVTSSISGPASCRRRMNPVLNSHTSSELFFIDDVFDSSDDLPAEERRRVIGCVVRCRPMSAPGSGVNDPVPLTSLHAVEIGGVSQGR